ncbi:hypothetical protein ACLMJK_005583 [Lecanora helva]
MGYLPEDWASTTFTDGDPYIGMVGTKRGLILTTVTTAIVDYVNEVAYKKYMVNPWSSQPCPNTETSLIPSRSVTTTGTGASLVARGHSLVIPSSPAWKNGTRISTTVMGSFTFTSPSIYAHFTALKGQGQCGSTSIPFTMLTFSPGELSTIAGPERLVVDMSQNTVIQSTKSFNFRDLPCPPQSAMEAHAWKPKYGEPYRPWLAMPSQLHQIFPWGGACSVAFFSIFDPPKTLEPAAAMASDLTSHKGKASPLPLPPDPTQGSAAQETVETQQPAALPASLPKTHLPEETVAAIPASSRPKLEGTPVSDDDASVIITESKSRPSRTDTDPDTTSKDHRFTGSEGRNDASPWKIPEHASSAQSKDETEHFRAPVSDAIEDSQDTTEPRNTSTSSSPKITDEGSYYIPGFDPSSVSPDQISTLEQMTPEPHVRSSKVVNQGPSLVIPSPQSFDHKTHPLVSSGAAEVDLVYTPGIISSEQQPVLPTRVLQDSSRFSASEVIQQQSPIRQQNPLSDSSSLLKFIEPDNGLPMHHAETISIASHAIIASPSSVQIGASKVTPQVGPMTLSGGAAIDQGSSVVLGSQIFHIQSPSVAAVATFDGHTIHPVSNGAIVDGNTIRAGASPTVLSGKTISVDLSSKINIDKSIYQLSSAFPQQTTNLPNGAAAVILPSAISVHGTTFSAGAKGATVSGAVVSLDSSNNLIYGATTVPIPTIPESPPLNPDFEQGAATTINGHAVVPLKQGISIAGSTLTPGALPITVSATLISLGKSALIIGTGSVAFTPQFQSHLVTTVGGQALTAEPSAVLISDNSLTPGAHGITIGKMPVSSDSNGAVFIGSNTISLERPVSNTSVSSSVESTAERSAAATTSVASHAGSSKPSVGEPGVGISTSARATETQTAGAAHPEILIKLCGVPVIIMMYILITLSGFL